MVIPANIPRVALVTGGARRIGRHIVHALATQGFSVAIHYRRGRDEAEALLAELAVPGCVIHADLADEKQVIPLVRSARERLGPVGVLVNNASVFERDEWRDATRESWDRHLEPNLRAPFVLMQQFAEQLPEEAQGVIVNMLDQRVWNLTPHFMSYTVSKAALWTLTQTLALAFAPRICVNAIDLGQHCQRPGSLRLSSMICVAGRRWASAPVRTKWRKLC